MSLAYKDFFPTVSRAGQWILGAGVRVINVETVVLPNIKTTEEASKIGIRTGGETGSNWYQVVRVWYEGQM